MNPADLATQVVTMAVTVGTVQVLKYALPLAPKIATVGIALVAAEVWSEAAALSITHSDPVIAAMIGFTVWLGAMGAWSGVKTILANDVRPQGDV